MRQEDWGYLAKKMWGPIGLSNEFFSQGEWNLFGIVWTWATKQEWWEEFMRYTDKVWREAENTYINRPFVSIKWLIHPTRFPQLITDFLREKGEYDGLCI